jgi:drug/metabolite transporter (DMT)-like permease
MTWGHVLAVGVPAGVVGYIGLASFYAALAKGTMGVVAPITALGAVVPVGYGLVQGDRPTSVQTVGVVIALIGVVLASGPELTGARGSGPLPLVLAVVAAVSFGVTLTLITVGSRTSALATIGVMRVTTVAMSLVLVTVVLARSRGSLTSVVGVEARDSWSLAAVGAFDVLANVTFGVASTKGLVSIVSVAGSLYPVATVLLARFVHQERLLRIQQIGVVLALVGVALIASA